jgi:hypothetical protein
MMSGIDHDTGGLESKHELCDKDRWSMGEDKVHGLAGLQVTTPVHTLVSTRLSKCKREATDF